MDTEPEIARDAGPLNIREAKAALDYHVAKAAKRGDYGCVCDLQAVAETIDGLVAIAQLEEIDPHWSERFAGDWQRAEAFYRAPNGRLIGLGNPESPPEFIQEASHDDE